jgi:hypothetical protein
MMFGPGRFGFLLAPIALLCLPTELPVSPAHGSLSRFLMLVTMQPICHHIGPRQQQLPRVIATMCVIVLQITIV